MKRVLFLFFVAVTSLQAQFITDINGRPVFATLYTDVEGSPYLRDDYEPSSFKAVSGKKYEVARARYNAYQNELEYMQKDKPLVLSQELIEFTLRDGTYRRGFMPIDDLTDKQFYNVLYDGTKVKLLKRVSVIIQKEKPYNSATETKRFVKNETYYLSNQGKMTRLKKDKKSLLEALSDKKDGLEAFIKEQKLRFSNENELILAVEKYETL
jgi:hypothetical protein